MSGLKRIGLKYAGLVQGEAVSGGYICGACRGRGNGDIVDFAVMAIGRGALLGYI